MAEYDDALLAKAAEAALAARWPDGSLVESLTAKTAPMVARAVLDAVAPMIAAQALREADRIRGRQDTQEAATAVSSPSAGSRDVSGGDRPGNRESGEDA